MEILFAWALGTGLLGARVALFGGSAGSAPKSKPELAPGPDLSEEQREAYNQLLKKLGIDERL